MPPHGAVRSTYRACIGSTFVRSRQVIRFTRSNASGPRTSTQRSTATSHSVTSFRSASYSVTGSSYSVGSSMWLYRPQLLQPWRFVASKYGDLRYHGWT